MESVFVALYPLVALISFYGYIPQIVKLVRARTPIDGIAVQSWLLWIVNCVISLGYGFFHLKDAQFMITMGVSMVSMVVVVGLVLYNRHLRFKGMQAAGAHTGGVPGRPAPCLDSLRKGGLV